MSFQFEMRIQHKRNRNHLPNDRKLLHFKHGLINGKVTHPKNFAWLRRRKGTGNWLYFDMEKATLIIAIVGAVTGVGSLLWNIFTWWTEKAESKKKEIYFDFEINPFYNKTISQTYNPSIGIPMVQNGNTLSVKIINKFSPIIIIKILLKTVSDQNEKIVYDLKHKGLPTKTINAHLSEVYSFNFGHNTGFLEEFIENKGIFEIHESDGKIFKFPHNQKYIINPDGNFELNSNHKLKPTH